MNKIIEQFIKEHIHGQFPCQGCIRDFGRYLESNGYEIVKKEVETGMCNSCKGKSGIVCHHLDFRPSLETPTLPDLFEQLLTGIQEANKTHRETNEKLIKSLEEQLDYLKAKK